MKNKKIAAIVPAFNEEKNVGRVLKVLLDSKLFTEVIMVDDGSTDKTARIGEKIGAKVIRLVKNKGKGNALARGIRATNAEIVAFFDADLVNLSQEHISALIEPMSDNKIAMCVGIRGRWWGLPEAFVKIDPMLALGGERAVRRELFEKIPVKFLQGFAAEMALNYYCKSKKLPVKYVALKNLEIITKEKKWGFAKGFLARIKMIFEIIRIRLELCTKK